MHQDDHQNKVHGCTHECDVESISKIDFTAHKYAHAPHTTIILIQAHHIWPAMCFKMSALETATETPLIDITQGLGKKCMPSDMFFNEP